MRRTLASGLEVFVTVISHLRPRNIGPMTDLVGAATWIVGHGEAGDYADAPAVVEGGGLCESRNCALDLGHDLGLPVVELSDDLRKLQRAQSKSRADLLPLAFDDAVQLLHDTATGFGACLAGAAPTANPFFFNPKRPVRTGNFIVGDLLLVLPSRERFDTALKLKEDYDFTLQHIRGYGSAVRCDSLLATFLHRGNAGGAVAFRTSEREQEAIRYLKGKWPGLLHDHPSRADELVLRLR